MDETLDLFGPDHQPFVTYLELTKNTEKLAEELRQLRVDIKAEQVKFAKELAKRNKKLEELIKKEKAIHTKNEILKEQEQEQEQKIQALKERLKQLGLL